MPEQRKKVGARIPRQLNRDLHVQVIHDQIGINHLIQASIESYVQDRGNDTIENIVNRARALKEMYNRKV